MHLAWTWMTEKYFATSYKILLKLKDFEGIRVHASTILAVFG
jgi:hypothetical protein